MRPPLPDRGGTAGRGLRGCDPQARRRRRPVSRPAHAPGKPPTAPAGLPVQAAGACHMPPRTRRGSEVEGRARRRSRAPGPRERRFRRCGLASRRFERWRWKRRRWVGGASVAGASRDGGTKADPVVAGTIPAGLSEDACSVFAPGRLGRRSHTLEERFRQDWRALPAQADAAGHPYPVPGAARTPEPRKAPTARRAARMGHRPPLAHSRAKTRLVLSVPLPSWMPAGTAAERCCLFPYAQTPWRRVAMRLPALQRSTRQVTFQPK